jgi:hypothetical protein
MNVAYLGTILRIGNRGEREGNEEPRIGGDRVRRLRRTPNGG